MAKGKFEGTLCDLIERELDTTRRPILMECDAVHYKILNVWGSYQLTVEEIPRIDPLKILKFLKELKLEELL